MSLTAAKQRFPVYDDDQNIKNPSLGWIIPFMLVTCFVGVFFIVPFGKVCHTNLLVSSENQEENIIKKQTNK